MLLFPSLKLHNAFFRDSPLAVWEILPALQQMQVQIAAHGGFAYAKICSGLLERKIFRKIVGDGHEAAF